MLKRIALILALVAGLPALARAQCSGPGGVPFGCTAATASLGAADLVMGGAAAGSNTVRFSGAQIAAGVFAQVPALSGGGTTNFLRADGTWATPPGGGGGGAGSFTSMAVSGATTTTGLSDTSAAGISTTGPLVFGGGPLAGGGNGGSLSSILTYNLPTSGSAIRNRAINDNVTVTSNSSVIDEGFTITRSFGGSSAFTITTEVNGHHVFLEDVAGGPTFNDSWENYEASTYLSDAHNTVTSFDALQSFTATGTITSVGISFSSLLSNANPTVGAIAEWDDFVCQPVNTSGGGSLPTKKFCLKNSDPHSFIDTAGNVLIGTFGTPSSNFWLQVAAPDVLTSNYAIVVTNSASKTLFRVRDDGGLSQFSGPLTLGLSQVDGNSITFYGSTAQGGGTIMLEPPTSGALANHTLILPNTTGTLVSTNSAPVFTSEVTTIASATGSAGFNLPQGAAPTAPVNGDLWTTNLGLYVQINGGTVGPLGGGGSGSLTVTDGVTSVTASTITFNSGFVTNGGGGNAEFQDVAFYVFTSSTVFPLPANAKMVRIITAGQAGCGGGGAGITAAASGAGGAAGGGSFPKDTGPFAASQITSSINISIGTQCTAAAGGAAGANGANGSAGGNANVIATGIDQQISYGGGGGAGAIGAAGGTATGGGGGAGQYGAGISATTTVGGAGGSLNGGAGGGGGAAPAVTLVGGSSGGAGSPATGAATNARITPTGSTGGASGGGCNGGTPAGGGAGAAPGSGAGATATAGTAGGATGGNGGPGVGIAGLGNSTGAEGGGGGGAGTTQGGNGGNGGLGGGGGGGGGSGCGGAGGNGGVGGAAEVIVMVQ
jgi:hypothetical protein